MADAPSSDSNPEVVLSGKRNPKWEVDSVQLDAASELTSNQGTEQDQQTETSTPKQSTAVSEPRHRKDMGMHSLTGSVGSSKKPRKSSAGTSTGSVLFPLLTQYYFAGLFFRDSLRSEAQQSDQAVSLEDVFRFCSKSRPTSFGKSYLVSFLRPEAGTQLMAIKVLGKKDSLAYNSIRNEAQCLKKLNGKPFFRQLLATFQTRSGLCLVTDFKDRTTMAGLVEKVGMLPVQDIRFYIAEITCALGFLHQRGVIHRSLSASNVVIDTGGHVILFDLGFVTFLPTTNLSLFDGPPYDFLAPEMVRGEIYNKVVDWWALGVLMYYCMYHRMPFVGSEAVDTLIKINERQPTFVGELSDNCAIDLCKSLLVKNPMRRLGNGVHDAEIVKNHPFFESIAWDAAATRTLTAPVIPKDVPFPYSVLLTEEFPTLLVGKSVITLGPPSPASSCSTDEPSPLTGSISSIPQQPRASSRSSSSLGLTYRQLLMRQDVEESKFGDSFDKGARLTVDSDAAGSSYGGSSSSVNRVHKERLEEFEEMKRDLRDVRRLSSGGHLKLRIDQSISRLNSFDQKNNNSVLVYSLRAERYYCKRAPPGFPRYSASEPVLVDPRRHFEKLVSSVDIHSQSLTDSEPILYPHVSDRERRDFVPDLAMISSRRTHMINPVLLYACACLSEAKERKDRPNEDTMDKHMESVGCALEQTIEHNGTDHLVWAKQDSDTSVQYANITDDNFTNLSNKYLVLNSQKRTFEHIDIGDLEVSHTNFNSVSNSTATDMPVRAAMVEKGYQLTSQSRFAVPGADSDSDSLETCGEASDHKSKTTGDDAAPFNVTITDTIKDEERPLTELTHIVSEHSKLQEDLLTIPNHPHSDWLQNKTSTPVHVESKSDSKPVKTRLQNSMFNAKDSIKHFPVEDTGGKETIKERDHESQNINDTGFESARGPRDGDSYSELSAPRKCEIELKTLDGDQHNSVEHTPPDESETKQSSAEESEEVHIPIEFLDLFVTKTKPKTSLRLKTRALQSEVRYRQVCKVSKKKILKELSKAEPKSSASFESQNESSTTHGKETTFPASPKASPLTTHKCFASVRPRSRLTMRRTLSPTNVSGKVDAVVKRKFWSRLAKVLSDIGSMFRKRRQPKVEITAQEKEISKPDHAAQTHPQTCPTKTHCMHKCAVPRSKSDALNLSQEIAALKVSEVFPKTPVADNDGADFGSCPNVESNYLSVTTKRISAELGTPAIKGTPCNPAVDDNQTGVPPSSQVGGFQMNSKSFFARGKLLKMDLEQNDITPGTTLEDRSFQKNFEQHNGYFESTSKILQCCDEPRVNSSKSTWLTLDLEGTVTAPRNPIKLNRSNTFTSRIDRLNDHRDRKIVKRHSFGSEDYSDKRNLCILPLKALDRDAQTEEEFVTAIQNTHAMDDDFSVTPTGTVCTGIKPQMLISNPKLHSFGQVGGEFDLAGSAPLPQRKSKSCQLPKTKNELLKTAPPSTGSRKKPINPLNTSTEKRCSAIKRCSSEPSSLYLSACGTAPQTDDARNEIKNAAGASEDSSCFFDKGLKTRMGLSPGFDFPVINVSSRACKDCDTIKNDIDHEADDQNADEPVDELLTRFTKALKARERLMADVDTISPWETWQCPSYSQRFCGDGSGTVDINDIDFGLHVQRTRAPRGPDKVHDNKVVGTLTIEYTKPPVEGLIVLR